MQASIVICTFNRAKSLQFTLDSLSRIEPLKGNLSTELIVVDNGSSDDTEDVVRQCSIKQFAVEYRVEPRRGQVYARNTALAMARGKVVLFIDDDVRPPADWLEGMCGPILCDSADAVAGGVTIPKNLDHEWMTATHRAWFASTDWLSTDAQSEMVGANMAFNSSVLARVPQFDPELGPGALGFGDDSLFSWQLIEAGFRLVKRLDVAVEHHFEPSRQSRAALEAQARNRGETQAYITHHWLHKQIQFPRFQLLKRVVRLAQQRATRQKRWPYSLGMPDWEMLLLRDIHLYRGYLKEQQRARCYEQRGLVKLWS